MATIQIFNSQTTDGNSVEFNIDEVNPNQKQDPMMGIGGVFDGAIIKLQWEDPDGNWQDTDVINDMWTDSARFPLFLDSFSKFRLDLSNAGASTSINAWVFGAK